MNDYKWIGSLAIIMVMGGLIVELFLADISQSGDFVHGYFAAGEFALGVFAAGMFSVGIFSVGMFSVGIFSAGIFNVGLFAIGFLVVAYRRRYVQKEGRAYEK